MGLASKSPLRAGIDVAWAVEARPNKLYGSAIAHAYHLESVVAQWPRIVVGDGALDYLKDYAKKGDNSLSAQYRRLISEICLSMLMVDIDGNHSVDYLGQNYTNATKATLNQSAKDLAILYIEEQISHWGQQGNEKLVERYKNVQAYFIGS